MRQNKFAANALTALVALTLSGCVGTSVMPVSGNTFEITASAAPVCGAIGAQSVASRDAAIATIRNGFDAYIILGGQAQDNVGVVGYTPETANTYELVTPYGATSTTTYSGGYPIVAGTHDQAITVQMFHDDDPGAANAIQARTTLGPNWQDVAANGFPKTCW